MNPPAETTKPLRGCSILAPPATLDGLAGASLFSRTVHGLVLSTAPGRSDFVIEVISPSDRPDMMAAKIRDWLRAGVQLLWYVDPETGDATVYRGDRVTQVPAEETLDGIDIVPGFRIRLRDVLNELDEETQ
jgi:hypothetical protein